MGIELTQAELDEYMLNSSTVILCVSREGKAPLAVPMWFGWRDNTIYINTALQSKKVGAIRKNPLVSCLVESGQQYFKLKAVLLMGLCGINENQDEVNIQTWHKWLHEVKPLYRELFPKKLPPHLERMYTMPRVTLKITRHSITSWDFSKVRV